MSVNNFRELGTSGYSNMSDETKLKKRDSLETDAFPLDDGKDDLCCQFSQVKITSPSAIADDPGVQDKPGEAQAEKQSGESGIKTSGLLQHVSGREHGADDVRGGCGDEGNAAKGACGGGCDASEQPESTTHQESLPPTTKPDNIVGTSQQVEAPRTPNPTQEPTSQPLLKPNNEEPPVEVEYYDILLLFSELDQMEAKQFMAIAERAKWKVATREDFLPTQTKLNSFENVFECSSYTVLLLTSNFLADVWCDHQYQSALTQSIEDADKKHSVIPIICQEQNLKMPIALNTYTAAKLKNPKIEKILQRTIKVAKRLQRQNLLAETVQK